ncbi:TlpA disulfide reductase family protein [Limibacter armeniacum]|uniref:TlpA family protein disulfide reductase n=1 Tax=Limibacter armeniacum TaxID=466084 RepID=UPI002FE622FB
MKFIKMIKWGMVPTLAATMFACQQQTSEVAYASLKGNVKGEEVLYLKGSGTSRVVKVTEQGTFNFDSLTVDSPTMLTLSNKKGMPAIQVYLSPGKELNLQLAGDKDWRAASFIGEEAYLNTLNHEVTVELQKEFRNAYFAFGKYYNNYEAFLPKIDSVKKEVYNWLAAKEIEDQQLREMFRERAEYHFAAIHLGYPNNYYTWYKKEIVPTEDLNKYIEGLKKDDAQLYELLPEYKSFISEYWKYLKQKEENRKGEELILGELYDLAVANFKSANILESLLIEETRFSLRYQDINLFIEDLPRFFTLIDNEKVEGEIKADFEDYKRLQKGKPAPIWEAVDQDGKKYTLSDFKGKYLYVDFWATWCAPCVKEIPHMAALEKAYEHNDKIVFVSYSQDEDENAWKKKLESKNMHGIQLRNPNGGIRDSIIRNKYRISGIPRFMLIDPEGNIVSVDVPRPSEVEKVHAFLDSVLD